MTNDEIKKLQDKLDKMKDRYNVPYFMPAFISGYQKALLEFKWELERMKADLSPEARLRAELMVHGLDERPRIPVRAVESQ